MTLREPARLLLGIALGFMLGVILYQSSRIGTIDIGKLRGSGSLSTPSDPLSGFCSYGEGPPCPSGWYEAPGTCFAPDGTSCEFAGVPGECQAFTKEGDLYIACVPDSSSSVAISSSVSSAGGSSSSSASEIICTYENCNDYPEICGGCGDCGDGICDTDIVTWEVCNCPEDCGEPDPAICSPSSSASSADQGCCVAGICS